jgi:hypothetical protein
MMLGDMLQEANAAVPRIGRGLATEAALRQRLETVAAAEDRSVARCVRTAVARFAREADEEAWTLLASRLRTGDDPGGTCLRVMLRHWLDGRPAVTRRPSP